MMLDRNDYRKQRAASVKEVGQLSPDAIEGYTALHAARQKRDLLGAKIREFIALAVAVCGAKSSLSDARSGLILWGTRMKRAMSVAAILSVCCFAAKAQTVSVQVLDQSGAQAVLASAVRNAQARHAPSAIAVVDPAGDLLAFQRMDGVRPASVELAIQKARTAARLQRPTAEIEDNIDHGRTAFVTADIPALQGGVPIRVDNQVVGAVGVAGMKKETDTEISSIAAEALSPPQNASAPKSPPSP